ncbi:MAG TPA: hypothetical protein VD978_29825 [Azospirillum sp.]|nr:hypothetical protein [Azospirillum sp.]
MSSSHPNSGHAATLAEVLSDPILDLLLEGDGLSRDDLNTVIENVRHKLRHEHDDPVG